MTIASRSSTGVFHSSHPRSKTGPVAGHSWLTAQAASKESSVGIEVRNLSKRYGTFQAIKDVSFEVIAGQLVALLGPSGSGKSTILRIIAGLETADTGGVV
ncbi:MAG: ATP-binding cassette domain-containing protein, partial [Isosphaeraceae bacterium]